MLKVYGMPQTRASRVLWLLEELSVPAELHRIDPKKGEHHQPDYWRINPFGKVPCITLGDFALAESAAICTWLGDTYPDKALIPKAGSRARGTHDQWMYYAMTELEAPLWLITKNKIVLPESERVPEIIPQAMAGFGSSCQVLAAHMQSRAFVLGDHFQVVDVLVGSILMWALSLNAPGIDKGLLGYVERLKARDAFQRFVQKHR